MNLNVRTKILRALEKEIETAHQRFDNKEVENLINIIHNDLGFRLKANELREDYYIKSA